MASYHNAQTADRSAQADGASQAAPAISLPKGGGAIRGIDQKFSVNANNGTASQTVPLPLSPGRSGFGPSLALSYSAGAGNGPFGLGWQLSLPSVSRKTEKGLPRYLDGEDSDTFVLSDAEDLVPLLLPDAAANGGWTRHATIIEEGDDAFRVERFRPRVEGLFARIERWTDQRTGDTHWRSISRDNVTAIYGRTAAARITDPLDAFRVFQWLIEEQFDDRGNVIAFAYKPEDLANVDPSLLHETQRLVNGAASAAPANKYLKRILYGNRTPFERDAWHFHAVFDYGDHDAENPTLADAAVWPRRPDAFSTCRPGFELRTWRLCRRVLMFHAFPTLGDSPALVRSLDLHHEENPVATRLAELVQRGYIRRADASGYDSKALPPISFGYSRVEIDETVHDVDSESLENLPTGLGGGSYQWVDLDGEGLSGVLTEERDALYYKRNLGDARFAPKVPVATAPSLGGPPAGRTHLADLAGDGTIDLVLLERHAAGYFERDADLGWSAFAAFKSGPNVDWGEPNHRLVDLTGDGLPDLLLTQGDSFLWHPSLGEEGFAPARTIRLPGDEAEAPRLVFADSTDSIYLADMNGDGLADLVRIRNAEVCYWPNLGYGRFGASITMSNAPLFDSPDLFNQRLVRLADIDGSGLSDLIYLSSDGVRVYFNQAGNAWSDGRALSVHLDIDIVTDVAVIDLLGNGTSCLVWSSALPSHAGRQLRYIDLMGGQKPHLLTSVSNNMGLETHVQHAPSTRFYLEDQLAGRSWASRLPFPVHVVERVETRDLIAETKLVTTYRYHHGHFDGTEREFRGFGMVEQFDTESFAAFAGAGTFTEPPHVEGEEFHLAPVLTRSWFHTGAYIDGARLSRHFEGEYYAGDPDAALLPDTRLPEGLTAEEEREAARALKGSLLRQEVYALDGSDAADHPYTVTETAYSLKRLQPRLDQPYSVFHAHQCEVLTGHYERNPADPRISHALTLEIDDFGNVLKSATVGYGRRPAGLASIELRDRPKQATTLVTYTENRFTNLVDVAAAWRTPLPSEARTWELTGYTPTGEVGHFHASDFVRDEEGGLLLEFDEEIAHEQMPTLGRQRRLIGHQRTLYRPDDMGSGQSDPNALLPLGQLESLASPGETYRLAFTPVLASQVYVDSGGLTAAELDQVLADEGRYLQLDGEEGWWIASGRTFYHPDPDIDAAQELAEARQHFFLPRRLRTPFTTDSTLDYDAHDIATVRSRDALGNTVEAEIDYRTLQPSMVTDPNGNRSRAAFDALGLAVGTAVQGKVSETLGDNLDGFQADLPLETIRRHLDDPLGLAPDADSPHAIVGNASSRFVYDLDRFRDFGQPPVAYSITRETHAADLAPGEQTRLRHRLVYSDGSGREVMSMVQAEPGPLDLGEPDAPTTDPRWVGTGRTIRDNKANPIKQYEPFFSATHGFETEQELVHRGVTPILRYDPLGRVVRTDLPDGTFARVAFDPWHQTSWDQNDTVLQSRWFADRQALPVGDPERRAADITAQHADTPTTTHLDTLGRVFLTIADNGPAGRPATRFALDITGNTVVVTDARDRDVETKTYNLLGTALQTGSMDSGTRWLLLDVAGNPVRAWDSRGHRFRTLYDELRRRTHSFVQVEGENEILVARHVYGEAHPQAEQINVRGRVFLQLDQSGLAANAGLDPDTGDLEAYDFKGNPLRSHRRLAREFRETADWSSLAEIVDPSAVEVSADALLEGEVFTLSTRYDALNRPIAVIAPDASELRPRFNEASHLDHLEAGLRGAAQATTFIENIDCDEKGRRTRIRYGNGVTTDYGYDSLTFRLRTVVSRRSNDGVVLQDLSYVYDPVGNVIEIADVAQPAIFSNNQAVEPRHLFVYDALYRLVEASGREHPAGTDAQVDHRDPPIPPAHPNDGTTLRNYTERYAYDEVGNILSMAHQANGNGWTRHYSYDPDSNRLLATSLPGDAAPPGPLSASYEHDVHGNMTRMPHLTQMEWDFADRMHRVDLGGGGEALYVYNAAGQRVRKVVERNGSVSEERIYLGGFEIFRRRNGSGLQVERETLHIMDDSRRVTLVETLTVENGNTVADPAAQQRYQLGNLLDSATLEVDESAQVISYEEYFPFGASSYRAGPTEVEVGAKRYRYSGKERDEETRLYYHGARYYVPWLGRWTATDPIGLRDGVNLYSYVSNRPVTLLDPNGKSGRPNDQTHAYSRREYHEDEFEPEVVNPGFTPSIPIASGRGQPLYTASDDEDRWVEPGRPGLLEEAHAPGPEPHPDRPRGVVSDKAIAIMKAKWPTMKRTGMHVGLLFITGATGGVAEALGAGIVLIGAVGGATHGTGQEIIEQVEEKGAVTDLGAVGEEGAKQAAFGGLFGYAFKVLGPIAQRFVPSSNKALNKALTDPRLQPERLPPVSGTIDVEIGPRPVSGTIQVPPEAGGPGVPVMVDDVVTAKVLEPPPPTADERLQALTDAITETVNQHARGVQHWPLIRQFWPGRTPANDVRLRVVKEVANDGLYPKKNP